MTNRSFLLIGAAFLAVATMPAGQANGASGTPCTFEYEVVLSPGVSSSPSSGTLTSNGETGTITCNGAVNGKQPTGPGKFGVDGRYGTKNGFTCQSGGNVEGVLSFTIPTSSGTEHVTSHFTGTAGGLNKGFSAQYDGERMSGTSEATPQDGDCASRPITKGHVKGTGTLN